MKSQNIPYSKYLFGITIILFVFKLFILLNITETNLFEVHNIAVNMIQKNEMSYYFNGQTNFNSQFPIYPICLFFVYSIFGIHPFAGIVLNLFFQALAVVLSYPIFLWFLSKMEINISEKQKQLIAFLSSMAIVLHPLINYYALKNIHPFSLDLFLVFLSLFCMTKYFETKSKRNFVLFAFVFGIATLSRTTNFSVIAPFLIFQFGKEKISTILKRTFFLITISILVMSTWLVRNYFIYQKISINSDVGLNLWLGVQEKTEGTTAIENQKNYYNLLPESEWQQIAKLKPIEQSDYFKKKYLQECSNNFLVVVKMYFIKLKNFWLFRSGLGIEYSNQIQKWIPVYEIIYSIIFILSLLFVFLLRKKSILIFSFPVFLSLFQAIFYVETRHRIMIEPFLICMAIVVVFVLRNKQKP